MSILAGQPTTWGKRIESQCGFSIVHARGGVIDISFNFLFYF